MVNNKLKTLLALSTVPVLALSVGQVNVEANVYQSTHELTFNQDDIFGIVGLAHSDTQTAIEEIVLYLDKNKVSKNRINFKQNDKHMKNIRENVYDATATKLVINELVISNNELKMKFDFHLDASGVRSVPMETVIQLNDKKIKYITSFDDSKMTEERMKYIELDESLSKKLEIGTDISLDKVLNGENFTHHVYNLYSTDFSKVKNYIDFKTLEKNSVLNEYVFILEKLGNKYFTDTKAIEEKFFKFITDKNSQFTEVESIMTLVDTMYPSNISQIDIESFDVKTGDNLYINTRNVGLNVLSGKVTINGVKKDIKELKELTDKPYTNQYYEWKTNQNNMKGYKQLKGIPELPLFINEVSLDIKGNVVNINESLNISDTEKFSHYSNIFTDINIDKDVKVIDGLFTQQDTNGAILRNKLNIPKNVEVVHNSFNNIFFDNKDNTTITVENTKQVANSFNYFLTGNRAITLSNVIKEVFMYDKLINNTTKITENINEYVKYPKNVKYDLFLFLENMDVVQSYNPKENEISYFNLIAENNQVKYNPSIYGNTENMTDVHSLLFNKKVFYHYVDVPYDAYFVKYIEDIYTVYMIEYLKDKGVKYSDMVSITYNDDKLDTHFKLNKSLKSKVNVTDFNKYLEKNFTVHDFKNKLSKLSLEVPLQLMNSNDRIKYLESEEYIRVSNLTNYLKNGINGKVFNYLKFLETETDVLSTLFDEKLLNKMFVGNQAKYLQVNKSLKTGTFMTDLETYSHDVEFINNAFMFTMNSVNNNDIDLKPFDINEYLLDGYNSFTIFTDVSDISYFTFTNAPPKTPNTQGNNVEKLYNDYTLGIPITNYFSNLSKVLDGNTLNVEYTHMDKKIGLYNYLSKEGYYTLASNLYNTNLYNYYISKDVDNLMVYSYENFTNVNNYTPTQSLPVHFDEEYQKDEMVLTNVLNNPTSIGKPMNNTLEIHYGEIKSSDVITMK